MLPGLYDSAPGIPGQGGEGPTGHRRVIAAFSPQDEGEQIATTIPALQHPNARAIEQGKTVIGRDVDRMLQTDADAVERAEPRKPGQSSKEGLCAR